MSDHFVAEHWRAAAALWWSFAWRQVLAIATITLGLGFIGALMSYFRLIERETAQQALPWIFWVLVPVGQVDTFRRLIRVYGLRSSGEAR